jgi:tol-pal system protein YbgF
MPQPCAPSPPNARLRLLPRALWLLACCVCAVGCATSSQDLALRAELLTLQTRVDELEHTNRRLHARLNQHDHTLQLVDDQLRSQRLAHAQPPAPKNTTIHLTPPPAPPEARYLPDTSAYDDPSYGDPSPADPNDSLRMTWAQDPSDPAGQADTSPDAGDYEDIVVTDERVRAFISEHGSSASPYGDTPASSSGSPSTPRVPKAPVVHGDSLSVIPTNRQGRVISASPPPSSLSHEPASAANADPAPPPQASSGGDPVQPYRDGLDAYRRADYTAAIQHFEAFLNGNPPHDYIDNALYWLGDAYYGMGNYTQAAAYFHRVVKEHPTENKVPDALLKVGLTYQRLGRDPSAREVFQYLIDTYPRSEAARLARDKLSTAADAPAP